jgi:hypothetical protein
MFLFAEKQKDSMGIIADAVNDIFNKIEDFISFFIIYTLAVFVIGQYFGAFYTKSAAFDYPMWLLFIAVFLYVLKEALKPKKK